jgi:catechol 2,3-dioxygenase-like lactoylglutathione lyase family enzyme
MKTSMLAVVIALSAQTVSAQAPATPPAGPPPTGLVVGSGNFFSPIVGDLDKAVAFYRDGLGLDVQGAPANADTNPALRNMFGLPDAQLRWQIGRPPAMRTGVEIVEITKAASKRLEIVQADQPPETQAPPTANVIGVRVRLVVQDVDKALALYRDALGMKVRSVDEFKKDRDVNHMLGLNDDGQYRVGMLEVPTTGLIFEVIDFKGVDRRTVRGNIQDPGSTRIQLQMRDVDGAIDVLKRHGGAVVSTGGTTVNLPGRGGATTKVAIVRDPDNLFLVLLQAAPPPPAQ